MTKVWNKQINGSHYQKYKIQPKEIYFHNTTSNHCAVAKKKLKLFLL